MSWLTKNIPKDVADYLFNIKIKLPNRTLIQRDARPDVHIDFDLLENQLAETPEMLAYWDLILTEQKMVLAILERRNKLLRGAALKNIMATARDEGVELRRSDVVDLIEVEDSVIDIEGEIILQTKNLDRIKAVVEAIQTKSRHLQSLAGFKKEELHQTRA